MTVTGLTYADAVKILDDRQNRVVAALDQLTGGALLALATGGAGFVLSLFDAKAELVRLSAGLVKGLRERRGTRADRSERLAAAHTVLVVSAYFESLPKVQLPFDSKELTKADQQDVARGVLRYPVPMPAPQRPYEQVVEDLKDFYERVSSDLLTFVQGLAVWDSLDETRQHKFGEVLRAKLPSTAMARYDESFRRLAAEFPEVAFWANLVDHQATRAEMRTGLRAVQQVLTEIASGRAPDERRRALAAAYQAALRQPILRWAETPDDVVLPSLAEAYVNPDFRVAQASSKDRLSDESWWNQQDVRADLQEFLIGHLTSPQSTKAPLLVLGQPGSGKSVLTQILAARLPSSEYLVVRVVLREVPADADLQDQIERAVRSATGEHLTWPDLVRSAGDAMPVVMLDGFDELLQATGASQSDYLERVRRFQEREAIQGRPVAVLVTSRTVVADRARPVPGMVTLRLEPFAETHVTQWLEVWNRSNRADLTVQAVMAHSDLATQPLLLLMLALYDLTDGPLQRGDTTLDQSQLYERLLVQFAHREVLKTGEDSGIDRELLRLSVVALAMFNRGRLWVSDAELDADLAVLLHTTTTTGSDLRAGVTPAQDVIGKFFFIHQAQATRDDKLLKTYEFLHATFGEYLIIRLIVNELTDLIETANQQSARTRHTPADDSFLHAILSFAPLTIRHSTMAFLRQRIQAMPSEQRSGLLNLVLSLFHRSMQARLPGEFDDYQPTAVSVPAKYAHYSVNLVLLATQTGEQVSAADLFPGHEHRVEEWRKICSLWRSQLPAEGWLGLTGFLAIEPGWEGDQRTFHVHNKPDLLARFDPHWAYGLAPSSVTASPWHGWVHETVEYLFSAYHLTTDRQDGTFAHALEPFRSDLSSSIVTFFDFYQGNPVSAAHALIKLWIASGKRADQDTLTAAHEMCLRFALTGFAPYDVETRRAFRKVYLHQLSTDRERLPADWVQSAHNRILHGDPGADKENEEFAELLRDYLR